MHFSLRAARSGRVRTDEWSTAQVASASGSTCADAWDGALVRTFRRNAVDALHPLRDGRSRIVCRNAGWSKTCAFHDVVVDFAKMKDVVKRRPQKTRIFPTGKSLERVFGDGFLTVRGKAPKEPLDYIPALEPRASPGDSACDVSVDEPTLAYGHDARWNAGHTVSDLLQVALARWIYGGRLQNFLFVDGLKPHTANFRDAPHKFFDLYDATFRNVLRAQQFANASKVCFRELVAPLTPRPELFWDGWERDRACSFVAPSALLQRFNLESRHALGKRYGLEEAPPSRTTISVLIVDRKASANKDRHLADLETLAAALRAAADGTFAVRVEDLAAMSLEEQFRLLESTDVLVGAHGAGIAWGAWQLPLGAPTCCGVVELFPPGRYDQVRGHGNFARALGYAYARRPVRLRALGAEGVATVARDVVGVVDKIRARPACVRGEALGAGAPFLEEPPAVVGPAVEHYQDFYVGSFSEVLKKRRPRLPREAEKRAPREF